MCGSKKKRSTLQNKLYWAVLNQIAEDLYVKGQGFTSNCWHVYLRQRYLGCSDIVLPNKKVVTIPISTSTLDVEEFNEYIEKVLAWATEHGVNLPDKEGNI